MALNSILIIISYIYKSYIYIISNICEDKLLHLVSLVPGSAGIRMRLGPFGFPGLLIQGPRAENQGLRANG